MCFLIIGKKVCLNYTLWCAIVHTLVCTKTHLGVLFNTPVLRVYKNTNNEQDSAVMILRTYCSHGLTYDAKLQDCVESLPPPSAKEDKVRVLAWFSPSKDSQFFEQDFKTVI